MDWTDAATQDLLEIGEATAVVIHLCVERICIKCRFSTYFTNSKSVHTLKGLALPRQSFLRMLLSQK